MCLIGLAFSCAEVRAGVAVSVEALEQVACIYGAVIIVENFHKFRFDVFAFWVFAERVVLCKFGIFVADGWASAFGAHGFH